MLQSQWVNHEEKLSLELKPIRFITLELRPKLPNQWSTHEWINLEVSASPVNRYWIICESLLESTQVCQKNEHRSQVKSNWLQKKTGNVFILHNCRWLLLTDVLYLYGFSFVFVYVFKTSPLNAEVAETELSRWNGSLLDCCFFFFLFWW